MQTDEYARMRSQEDHYWWFVARRRLALHLLSQYGRPNSTVLDLGCGTGAVLTELQRKSEAVGLDVSPLALNFCHERGLPNLVLGDAQDLPFDDESFDAVVALDAMEHVRDDSRAMSEVARVLKPGGIAVLNVPAFAWLWGPHDVALMHFRRYTLGQMRSLVERSGLKPVKSSYSVFLLFPAVVAIRVLDRLSRRQPEVSLPPAPGPVNPLLLGAMDWESALMDKVSLPWGSSVVMVAAKPSTSNG